MALPDFVVAGVARAGTTTLYNLLKKHKQIYLPNVKETNYFSKATSKNAEDYRLPKSGKEYHTKIIKDWSVYEKLYKTEESSNKLKGDISPSYMWDLKSAERIRAKNKDAKIIITLRSPVDRVLSHYKMNYYTGYEKESNFKKALNKDPDGFWGGGNCYLKCSFYYESLKTYFDSFEKDNILILIYEDWIEDQRKLADSITEFLGIKYFKNCDLVSNHQNKVKPIKYLKVLNLLRNQNLKRLLKKTIPQQKIDGLKKKYFEGDDTKITIALDEEKKLKELFKEDVLKTGKLLDIDLLKKWGFD